MNHSKNQDITSALAADWTTLSHAILDRFTQVSKADLDAALDADDLVERISSKTAFDPSYVESQVSELVGVGASSQQANQPRQQQQFQQQQQQFSGQSRRSNRGGRARQQQQFSGQQTSRPLGSYGS